MVASNPSSAGEPTIVMVPVPVDRLIDVYTILASPSSAGTSPDGASGDGPPSGSAWSADDIARLRQALGPDTAARAILDLGSVQPEQPIWYGDVATHVGRSHTSVRSELAGFTKMLKSRFGRDDWPFQARWVDGRALYTVDTRVAQAWLGDDQDQEAAS